MKEALFNDKATGDDLLTDVIAKAIHWAISVPGNVGEEFKRMCADGITKEFFLGTKALKAIGLDQRDGGQAVEIGVREEPELGMSDERAGSGDLSIERGTVFELSLTTWLVPREWWFVNLGADVIRI